MCRAALVRAGLDVDIGFTSYLKRGIKTLYQALEEMDRLWVPVEKSWRINERHYGALQGFNKAEMAERVGHEQVQLDEADDRFPGHDRRYAALTDPELPRGESLKDTIERTLPYWDERIAPALREGRRVLVAAHGNSLRGLVKYLEDIADDDIPGLEIPTGAPLVYSLNRDLRPIEKTTPTGP